MKKVKEAMKTRGASDEEVKEFETGASGFAKKIIANFGDYEFLIGESMDPDAMYVDLRNRDTAWHVLTITQGCPPQLPRGRCYPLRHSLEARSQGDQGVSGSISVWQRVAGRRKSRVLATRSFGSLPQAISQDEHEQYGRHDFGNNLGLCLSLFHPKSEPVTFS